jgi:hypothetical protein
MSYLVVCSFDLKNASREDYLTAYAELEVLGLSTSLTWGENQKAKLPTTTAAGQFSGTSAQVVNDDLLSKIQAAFRKHGFTSEIFLSVGDNWYWGLRTT